MQLKHLVIIVATFVSSVISQDSTKSITDNVIENPKLTTLRNFISANDGLSKVLSGTDQMTILAPSDDAFAALGENYPKDSREIESIIRYHIINKVAKVNDLIKTIYPNTLLTEGVKLPDKAGQVVVVRSADKGNATISDGLEKAKIDQPDLEAKNGIIHIIDKVLMPPKGPSDTAKQVSELSTFSQTLSTKDLISDVDGEKEITIFAPNNEAFDKLSRSTFESKDFKDTMKYHIARGVFYSRTVENNTHAKTSQGDKIIITVSGGEVFVNDAKVITADILTNNGVIHVIDTVLDQRSAKSSAGLIKATSGVSLSAAVLFCAFAFLF
ncbi:6198_t:CDS:2 [Funneliformis geosporum]|uniref:564_t:CDS:1 n=1 Tax=Funneliformis geosporum TaxID=1117311 RepID=A0A9W4SLZ1_9GLOM|nr:6198_t:CDS:2 [Funneliformis geosporum]CAI2174303.1 564_t:CDS:2 [Funneliformis geosporum]